jgi:hypothetical protein
MILGSIPRSATNVRNHLDDGLVEPKACESQGWNPEPPATVGIILERRGTQCESLSSS